MIRTFVLITTLILPAVFALASTPPEAVPGIDATREGDLAKKVLIFYTASNPKGCDEDYGKTTYSVTKLGSGSSLDEKKPNSTITYEATYLALSTCNTGSTYVGAYRDISSAVIIHATRTGITKDGSSVVKPTQKDQFKVVRAIDPALLTMESQ